MQAGDGGRLYKGIFGTRCEATICVKVQLSDTQISIGKNDKAFIKSPPSERKSKLRVWEPSALMVGRKRGRKRTEGQEERKEGWH